METSGDNQNPCWALGAANSTLQVTLSGGSDGSLTLETHFSTEALLWGDGVAEWLRVRPS